MEVYAAGPFTVESNFEPPFHQEDGVMLGRGTFSKSFQGDLVATSTVWMTYARTPDPAVASYVALEQITGTLCGKSGSFAVTHQAHKTAEDSELLITVVRGSGTGELKGLTGKMTIEIDADGGHSYTFEGVL